MKCRYKIYVYTNIYLFYSSLRFNYSVVYLTHTNEVKVRMVIKVVSKTA